MKKRNFPLYKIFCLCSIDYVGYFDYCTDRMGFPCIFKIATRIGKWQSI